MARVEQTTCDNCGDVAPEEHRSFFPAGGWYGVKATYLDDDGEGDYCSAACIAAYFTRLAEERGEIVNPQRAEVDALEAVFAAPAAAPKPKRKPTPRKPRTTE